MTAAAILQLERLVVRDVRNLAYVDIQPGPHLNVVAGRNGQGKTSLLEAMYLAATSRSFRTRQLAEIMRHDAPRASVTADFLERAADGDLRRQQMFATDGRHTGAKVDGKRPATLAHFATRSPVVVFHPDELTLTTGPAVRRRTLLDRIALFVDPGSADHRARYARALKNRQRLLVTRGSASDSTDIEAFEELCAVHGAAVTRSRRLATELLEPELGRAFREIAARDLRLVSAYGPMGSEDAAIARAELRATRQRDTHRASASFGPHRDDLLLALDGFAARTVASQGQHRALTLALKIAEAACVASLRGVEPMLLLDDVSSELDAERNGAFFGSLARRKGQIFVTTARPELLSPLVFDGLERVDFEVAEGVVSRVSTGPFGQPDF